MIFIDQRTGEKGYRAQCDNPDPSERMREMRGFIKRVGAVPILITASGSAATLDAKSHPRAGLFSTPLPLDRMDLIWNAVKENPNA